MPLAEPMPLRAARLNHRVADTLQLLRSEVPNSRLSVDSYQRSNRIADIVRGPGRSTILSAVVNLGINQVPQSQIIDRQGTSINAVLESPLSFEVIKSLLRLDAVVPAKIETYHQ